MPRHPQIALLMGQNPQAAYVGEDRDGPRGKVTRVVTSWRASQGTFVGCTLQLKQSRALRSCAQAVADSRSNPCCRKHCIILYTMHLLALEYFPCTPSTAISLCSLFPPISPSRSPSLPVTRRRTVDVVSCGDACPSSVAWWCTGRRSNRFGTTSSSTSSASPLRRRGPPGLSGVQWDRGRHRSVWLIRVELSCIHKDTKGCLGI